MSAEPKPAHHPSCRESDKDLVWHCNQCGLNESAADIEAKLDQPKPASGEWTPWTYQIVDGYWHIYERGIEIGTVLSELNANSIVAAHNAALVTERARSNQAKGVAERLRQQLATEREKTKVAEDTMAWHCKEAAQLRSQLDAEREKLAGGETIMQDNDQLRKQLADERERVTKVMTLKMSEYMREVQQLREQLAAEKKKVLAVASEWTVETIAEIRRKATGVVGIGALDQAIVDEHNAALAVVVKE